MKPVENGKKKKILIIDDEPQIVELLKMIMDVYGYEGREYLSAKNICDTVTRESPDLILLDIAMPEIDGYQACRNLKANPETASIPIIFISALGLSHDKKLAVDAGAEGFIIKPFDPRDVIAQIECLLSSK